MRRARFTEELVIGVLKEAAAQPQAGGWHQSAGSGSGPAEPALEP
jgi:hypothetical protein